MSDITITIFTEDELETLKQCALFSLVASMQANDTDLKVKAIYEKLVDITA